MKAQALISRGFAVGLLLICAATIVAGAAGCRTQKVSDAYPGPTSSAGSVSNIPSELVVPTPKPDAGVVIGQLLTPGPGGKPYVASVYLGKAIYPSQGQGEPIIGFSEQTDPMAIQDASTGKFVFADVPPGTYGLVLWTPVGSNVVQDTKTSTALLITVEASRLRDLGVVSIP